MKFANCHFHSTHSDGEYRPRFLARMALGLGYKALALTDHDVLSGNRELLHEAGKLGLLAMPGVEITCRNDEIGFHLVGLNLDLDNPRLNAFVDQLCQWRNENTKALFDRGVKLGLLENITWDEVEQYNPGCRWFCNEQVFNAMELKGVYDPDKRPMQFKEVFASSTSVKLGMRIQEASITDAISVIRQADGIPVLAHPYGGRTKYVPELVEAGLLGIETCHPSLNEEDTRLAEEAAAAYKLYRSGGSDHNGVMSGCGLPRATPDLGWGADEEEFMAMLERRRK